MPTFETNVPPAAKKNPEASDSALSGEFRPRRREQWATAGMDETFDPAPIPPEVKKSITDRINEMMRQSRGPDETFFAIREWFSIVKKVLFSLPKLVSDKFRGKKDEDEDAEAVEQSETDPEETVEPKRPQPRNDDSQRHSQHRGRRGGRRHNRRGRQNPGRDQNRESPRNDSRDGD